MMLDTQTTDWITFISLKIRLEQEIENQNIGMTHFCIRFYQCLHFSLFWNCSDIKLSFDYTLD